jgi:competence protein ComEC
VVSVVPVLRKCASATVIDRFDLKREGAHAIWLEDGGIRVMSVNGERGVRPWVAVRKRIKRERMLP